jgi:histone deacetylase 1/2
MENANSHDYLHKIKATVIENIRRTGKPSVEAFTTIPNMEGLPRVMDSDGEDEEDDLDADANRDVRATQLQRDKRIEHGNELYDDSDDDEEYKSGLGVRAQPGVKRRRNITDFPNPNAAATDDIDALDGMEDINGGSAVSTRQPSAAVKSRTHTPAAAEEGDDDGDIDMDEPAAAVAPGASTGSQSPSGVVTPPESPAAEGASATTALAPTSAPTADVTMEGADDTTQASISAAKEAGQAERDSENVTGEVRTEVAKD